MIQHELMQRIIKYTCLQPTTRVRFLKTPVGESVANQRRIKDSFLNREKRLVAKIQLGRKLCELLYTFTLTKTTYQSIDNILQNLTNGRTCIFIYLISLFHITALIRIDLLYMHNSFSLSCSLCYFCLSLNHILSLSFTAYHRKGTSVNPS